MSKFFRGVTFTLAIGIGLVAASTAQAQDYPSVADVTQFTQSANYMSLPGYLRWRYFMETGRWIYEREHVDTVRDQLGSVPTAPTGDDGGDDGGGGTLDTEAQEQPD